MPTTHDGQTYHLGFKRGPSRPEKWAHELKAPRAADRTKPRSLAQYFMQPPFDQGSEGSCTANSGCLVAQACGMIDGAMTPVLSREFMYYAERLLINTFPQDSGADVIDEFDVDQQGNIADKIWPYDQNPSERPPAGVAGAPRYKTVAAYQPIAAGGAAALDAILTALDNRQPVAIGLGWSDSFTAAYANGQIVTPAMYKYMGEGHALTIKAYTPPGKLSPNGIVVLQGSWGQNSPGRTDIHPDAKAGDHYFDVSLIEDGQIVTDIYAGVPMAAPAIISVAVTPPASDQAGVAGAWSAQVTGAPAGSDITYSWSFSDGGSANGQNVSYTPAAAGTLTGTCTAMVPTTGAIGSGSGSVSVSPAPAPSPDPGPAPTPPPACQSVVDSEFAALFESIGPNPAPGSWSEAGLIWVTWAQENIDAALVGSLTRTPPPLKGSSPGS